MDIEEFRQGGHELIDWIADYRAGLGRLPVRARVEPGDVRRALETVGTGLGGEPGGDPNITHGPARIADLLVGLDRAVLPGITHAQHPRNFAWFPSNASLSSVLGDIAAAGIGALGITWQSAPALTEVEELVCDELRSLTGLSERWHGTITDGASSACLVALLVARERATGQSLRRGGLQSEPQALTVYYSADAHSSVEKAALLAGFGADNLRPVPVLPVDRSMDTEALSALLASDVAGGRRPAAIVATCGTTATTAFDPVVEICEVARQHAAYVHVDAAMAGSALLLPECRHQFEGIELADSICWNPHKWMGAVLETSLFYTAAVPELVGVMATDPSYLRSAADGSVTQFRDWGIPLGRRFRALKLWFQLALDGPEAIRARLRRDLANARRFAELVAEEPGWEVIAPVQLQTVCLRHIPLAAGGGSPLPEAQDNHTLAWCETVNASGAAHITPALLDGRWMVRVSIGAEATEWADVEALWALMREAAAAAQEYASPHG